MTLIDTTPLLERVWRGRSDTTEYLLTQRLRGPNLGDVNDPGADMRSLQFGFLNPSGCSMVTTFAPTNGEKRVTYMLHTAV